MDLSIVIPVYNEEEILEQSIAQVLDFFSSKNISWELTVVNDGSTDATGKILKNLQERDARVRVITFPENRGKGAAVKEGFLKSQGDYMLFFDADLSTPLSAFREFWQHKNEHTVLIASRALPASQVLIHQQKIKEWAGKWGNRTTRLLLPLPFRDTQCGYKLFPESIRQLLPLARISRAGFDIEWLMIAQCNGYSIKEVPVMWANRPQSRFTAIEYARAFRELVHIAVHYRNGRYHAAALKQSC